MANRRTVRVHRFIVTLKHDKGRVSIRVTASNAATAAKVVARAEGAPLRAVTGVRRA